MARQPQARLRRHAGRDAAAADRCRETFRRALRAGKSGGYVQRHPRYPDRDGHHRHYGKGSSHHPDRQLCSHEGGGAERAGRLEHRCRPDRAHAGAGRYRPHLFAGQPAAHDRQRAGGHPAAGVRPCTGGAPDRHGAGQQSGGWLCAGHPGVSFHCPAAAALVYRGTARQRGAVCGCRS